VNESKEQQQANAGSTDCTLKSMRSLEETHDGLAVVKRGGRKGLSERPSRGIPLQKKQRWQNGKTWAEKALASGLHFPGQGMVVAAKHL